jgi:hypothetical protein
LFNACVAVAVQLLQNNHQRSLEGTRRGPKQSSTRSYGHSFLCISKEKGRRKGNIIMASIISFDFVED